MRRPSDGWHGRAWTAAALLATALIAHALPPDLQQRLHRLPAALALQWQTHQALWARADAGQRAAIRAELARIDALPAATRSALRQQWRTWQALGDDDRRRILAARAAFAALPAPEQATLRARFAALPPDVRRGWLLGPRLGMDWPHLQPLLQFVPPETREVALERLRTMTAEQRRTFAAVAWRTPEQAREALLRQWLAIAPAQMDAWLWQQTDR